VSTRIDTIRAGVTNIYVLHDRGTVLIDPGGPPGGRVGLRKVLPRLGAPPRLNLIVITHGHFDHVGAASGLRDATGAPIAIHQADAAWLQAGQVVWPKGVTPWGRFARTVFGPVVMPLYRLSKLEPDLLIGDEGMDLESYGISGRVVHTPGHSPGSVSVVLPSGEAFVGDLAMNGLPFCLRPRFGIFAHHPERVADSWRKLLDMGVREVYPAHGRPFPASALVS
jgi:glyoxylase-like metal-dependent hydrolase (beta-lactamase superfamily II)